MKLNNKKSILTRRAEGTPVHSIGSRVTQKIYLLLLTGIVLFLAYIFLSRVFYMDERGLIEVERTQISSARGGRITSILVAQGQQVKQHDLLLKVEGGSDDCARKTDGQLVKLGLELQANKDKLKLLQQRLAERRKLISNKTLRRALEIDHAESSREKKIVLEIEDTELEVKLLVTEIRQQATMLKDLEERAHSNSECFVEEVRAPKAGVIHAVNKNSYEVVTRGEPILSFISDDAVVRVEAYVDDDDIGVVAPGKEASIELPDNQSLRAVVESVRSSASVRAEREWDHYTPVRTKLLVYLVPTSVVDAGLWKKFDRVNVKVSIRR